MSEIGTVVWKEWREHFLRRGRPSKTVVSSLVIVVLGGLVAPLTAALAIGKLLPPADIIALVGGIGLFATAFQGLVLNSSLIIDSFAGERERHTLETLLAGPLSDRSILVGKIASIQLFVAATALVEVVAQQILLLSFYGAPAFAYAPVLVAGPILALLFGLLVGAIGSIIGMRAATVKSGQQILAYSLLPIYFLPGFGQVLLTMTPPGRAILAYYDQVGAVLFIITVMAALAALDALLLTLAQRSFKRNRLLLVKR